MKSLHQQLGVLLFLILADGVTAFQPEAVTIDRRRRDDVPRHHHVIYSALMDTQSTTNEETKTAGKNNRIQNVKFAQPLLDYGYEPTVQEFSDNSLSKKPILLYLPGFDGTYICPFIQYPELGSEFEVWCMTVGMNDRSTFDELKQNVLDVIDDITRPTTTNNEEEGMADTLDDRDDNLVSKFQSFFDQSQPIKLKSTTRPIYLAGESFGGILASEVTKTLMLQQDQAINLKGLTLINPATCYDRSALRKSGPDVAKLPGFLYPFGLSTLLPLFTDEFSFPQLLLILSAEALPSVIDNPIKEAYMGRVAISLPFKLEYMPQQTLDWRLTEWLETGCQRMEQTITELSSIRNLRTLVVAGEKDNTLPSLEEAERLSGLLPNSSVHVVPEAGHASTCGSRVDLAAVMRSTFSELSSPEKRRSMKPQATDGEGHYFGMTKRYDGADIGLSPLLYWSKENHQATQQTTEEMGDSDRRFSKTIYRV